MKKVLVLLLGLTLVTPGVSEARHNYSSVDREELDDDVVETFPIPVLFGVEAYQITPDFGDPRSGGRTHEGQDMRAPKGTPIVSPTEAIVLSTGEGASAGKYVYTANPGGETFRYMHLDTIAGSLDRGDKLDAGDFIGTVGDTGNAPDGVYHLHFETRDDDNDPQDPYPRLENNGFTLKEKMSFLSDIFRRTKDDEEYAEFLVETFTDDFTSAIDAGYNLPDEIEDALKDQGVTSAQSKMQELDKLILSLPKLVNLNLQEGSGGPAVTLLQMFLVYYQNGPARDNLKNAGMTGYYGPVTAAAVRAYQVENLIQATGNYDANTRVHMQTDAKGALNFN